MSKYLLCIIIGIILYSLLNNRNGFSVGCLHISASGSPAFNMFDFDDSDDDEPDPEPTPAPTPGELFKIGDIVEAHSLQGAPQHNGKIGTVESFNDEKGRYTVALDEGGNMLSLKEANLQLVPKERLGTFYMSKGEIEERFIIKVPIKYRDIYSITYVEKEYIEVIDKKTYRSTVFEYNENDIIYYCYENEKIKKFFIITRLGKVLFLKEEVKLHKILEYIHNTDNIDDIDEVLIFTNIIEFFKDSISNSKKQLKFLGSPITENEKKRLITEKNIYFFSYISKYNKCYNPDLMEINTKLSELNTKLEARCPKLELEVYEFPLNNLKENIHHFYNSYEETETEETETDPSIYANNILILCLMYEGNCISSILLEYNRNKITISSETYKVYESKKYNKLLRSTLLIIVTLLICNESDNITHIESVAINPISAWYFLNPTNNFKLENVLGVPVGLEIKSFSDIEKSKSIIITMELNDHNNERAEVLFDELTKDEGALICP